MVVYREGELADKVYLVAEGEFELSRKLPRDISKTAAGMFDRFGGRKQPPPGYKSEKETKNILGLKYKGELEDVPEIFPLLILGPGSIVGEEDLVFRDYYSCTLKSLS